MIKNTLISCIILFCACKLSGQSLNGTSWMLLSFDNLKTSSVKSVEDKIQATLSFESDSIYKGKMCNSYTGKFTIGKEDALQMSQAGATKMYCIGISDVERDLFTFYSKVVRYKIKEDKLFIFTSDDYRLVFKKQ